MTRRLWDCLDDKSKAALRAAATEAGMLWYDPEKPTGEHPVAKLEDCDEIATLMTMTDSQIKERYEEEK